MTKDFKGTKVNVDIALIIVNNIEKLSNFITDSNNININSIDNDIKKIKQSKTFWIGPYSQSFYEYNKEIIEDILPVISIYTFLNNIVDIKTNDLRQDFREFVNYIYSHKESIDNICSLLEAIKELGIAYVVLDENNKFEYIIDLYLNDYSRDFGFGENITIIPTYEKNHIKYYLDGSNYIIPLTSELGRINIYSSFPNEIVVNNLLFDKSVLPKSKKTEDIIDVIVEKHKECNKSNTYLREGIDLSFSIEDLNQQLESTLSVVESLSNIHDKDTILNYLYSIKHTISRLKDLDKTNEESIIFNENNSVNQEVYNSEKDAFVKRRLNSSYDWC